MLNVVKRSVAAPICFVSVSTTFEMLTLHRKANKPDLRRKSSVDKKPENWRKKYFCYSVMAIMASEACLIKLFMTVIDSLYLTHTVLFILV
jgi:hypothetical protein